MVKDEVFNKAYGTIKDYKSIEGSGEWGYEGDVSAIMGDFLSCCKASTPLALVDKQAKVVFHSVNKNMKKCSSN